MFSGPRWRLSLFITIASVTYAGSLPAQEPAAISRTIEIGQSIGDRAAILQDRRIAFGEGGFQEARRNDDRSDLVFEIDRGTQARIGYSRATKKVTGISLYILPLNGASKTTLRILSAKRITLEGDGSYIVHFSPVGIEDEPASLPHPEYPSSQRR